MKSSDFGFFVQTKIMQDVLKSQGYFVRGEESDAIKGAVNGIQECAQRCATEDAAKKLVENFQFSTSQGQEVLEFLSSRMLSTYAHIFAKNGLCSIRKVSKLTSTEIVGLSEELSCATGEAQVSGRIRLGELPLARICFCAQSECAILQCI